MAIENDMSKLRCNAMLSSVYRGIAEQIGNSIAELERTLAYLREAKTRNEGMAALYYHESLTPHEKDAALEAAKEQP